jgi:hypothetical protein
MSGVRADVTAGGGDLQVRVVTIDCTHRASRRRTTLPRRHPRYVKRTESARQIYAVWCESRACRSDAAGFGSWLRSGRRTRRAQRGLD